MPTPNDLALLQQLAEVYKKMKDITALRNATAGSAKIIEAAYTSELAAQAELVTTAARMGVSATDALALAQTTSTTTSAATTAATAAGTTLSLPGILAGIAVLGALAGGIYMAKNWGKPSVDPVNYGPAMTTARPASSVKNSTPDNMYVNGTYYIYAVNTSGWSFFIGQSKDVENRASKTFQDGGTGDQPVEFKKLVDKPFNSYAEARDYLKARVSGGKQSYWTGTWKKFEGGEYRTVHVIGI